MDDLINRANLPSVLNGVTMSECDKVIEPFLEERSCDEVWHTVRALRDFYDWVMSENAVEPYKDAISREYALGVIYPSNTYPSRADIYKALKEAPSVTAEPKHGEWIPCEERLPNTPRNVLTYRPNMGMTMLVDSYGTVFDDDGFDEYTGWTYGGDNVIAWMELPKPWKGAGDE